MPIVDLTPALGDALLRFFENLPEGDRTFIKEEVTDPATVQAWATGDPEVRRWLSMDGDEVCGYVAVYRLPGWSDHVGDTWSGMATVGVADELGAADGTP